MAVATDLEIFQVRLQDEAFSFSIERPGSGYQNTISLWTQTYNLLLQYPSRRKKTVSQSRALLGAGSHFLILFSGRGSVWELHRAPLDPLCPARICPHPECELGISTHALSHLHSVVAQAMEAGFHLTVGTFSSVPASRYSET